MKLTDMSCDAMLDVVTTFAAEIEPLLDDDAVMNISLDLKQKDKETQIDYGRRVAKKTFEILTLISCKYKPALFLILAKYFQCSVDEVGKMSVKKIVAQVQDSINDEVLLGFFPQLRRWAQAGSSVTLQDAEDLPQKRRLRIFQSGSKSSRSKQTETTTTP